MNTSFDLAGGSIMGREHVRIGRNNQDAFYWSRMRGGAIAVVCDGCGSGLHSEVGAKLGSRLVATTLQRYLNESALSLESDQLWQTVYQDLVHQLQAIAAQLGDDFKQTVQQYLLFTIVGVVLTPDLTSVFACGDGVIAVNDEVQQIGPFAGNAPPYIAYGLFDEMNLGTHLNAFQLRPLQTLATSDVHSILIGSDGVSDLMAVADRSVPGSSDAVGAIAQFWQDDRYFKNPDQVRRRLAQINREVTQRNEQTQHSRREPGLLPDDTTLVVIRRREDSGSEQSPET